LNTPLPQALQILQSSAKIRESWATGKRYPFGLHGVTMFD
jgi:hypothetical protein